MKESEVCTKIVNTINDAGHWAFKIPDSIATPGTQYTREKAFDITARIGYHPVAIEVKIRENLPKDIKTVYNMLTKGEKKHLPKFYDDGKGFAFVFLCVFKNNRKASLRVHDLYLIPWRYLVLGEYPETMDCVKCVKKRYQLDDFLSSFVGF